MRFFRNKKHFFTAALLLSVVIHCALFSAVSLRIEDYTLPIFYSWSDILTPQDLLPPKGESNEIPQVLFRWHRARKGYFLSILGAEPVAELRLAPIYPFSPSADLARDPVNHLFLWQRHVVLPAEKKEQVAFKIFVSSYGKALFSVPEKLPLNSEGTLLFQQYLRESSVFFHDKFCWTKMEEVVQ
ncbi:MAG: hypothetical protein GF333_02690 [Candidatus Omnitrophica bacterium]|nr:hypothetical protein [Candidatus Omnitrophota bacterium]